MLCTAMFPIVGPVAARVGFLDADVLDDMDEYRRLRQAASTAVRALLSAVAVDAPALNNVCAGR